MKKMTNTSLAVLALCAAAFSSTRSASAAAPVPGGIFGQNLEHTRSAMQGGLSAQIVRNRKFAGKPDVRGVAMMWEAYGSHAVYENCGICLTRHAKRNGMSRQNERQGQLIGGLVEGGEAGIMQRNAGIRGGVKHTFKVAATPFRPDEDVVLALRVSSHGKTLAEKELVLKAASKTPDWQRVSFDFTVAENVMADISVGVKGRRYCVIGAVSLLPADNFRGMRADVVERLREIGTYAIRWPGGNFAGEYRWRDGLIADPDERAPLQSYMEIETQPHGLGYDQNDIGMDDIIALCDKIGARPFFTINPAFDSAQDSADWVKACKGRVKLWSLGNEFGYGHMEGPKGPAAYANMVRPHAEAMLKVDPSLELVASGPYPGGGNDWIEKSAKPLADIVPVVSCHGYDGAGVFDFSTPESTESLYARMAKSVDSRFARIRAFRKRLPSNLSMSYDEWNIWYAWFHEEGVIEGLYAAKMLHRFMQEHERLGIKYVCYFQAVNEKAIVVTPFESHLSSAGEAMRIWKGHVGGTPAGDAAIPDGAFATDAPDGSRYATFYNFSTVETRKFSIPAGGRAEIVYGETLVPNGFVSGCRYSRRPFCGKTDGKTIELELPPGCQACVRIR